MEKISILIAVYNAEETLRACLDSLLRQTYPSFQAICIDDASSDASLDILHSYAQRDKRIEVIHLNENGGSAHARNMGLKHATGSYVCFLDSDDWLADDALSEAMEVYKNHPETDTVLFNVMNTYEDHEEPYPGEPFSCLTGEEAFEKSLTWKIHGVYITRAEIHKRFPYDESCHAYSDDNTTRLHYLASREVRPCRGTYYYRQHAASVTHRVNIYRFDYLKANMSMKRQLLARGCSSRIITEYERARWINIVGLYGFYFNHRHELSPEDRRQGLTIIKEAWQSIEPELLDPHTTRKLGYHPFQNHWRLFLLQESIYFSLRKFLQK